MSDDRPKSESTTKRMGSCESCFKGGVIETVEVATVGTVSPTSLLHLCRRCATYPHAVWRRRFDPVDSAAGKATGRADLATG
jgi:hypothetical protein